jgi:hypothetical protein
MAWNGEIEPASFDQIQKGRDGRTHLITADAGNIAQRLREMHPQLRLRYSEGGDYYVVYLQYEGQPEDGQHGHLVGTFQECDGRIVKSIEETMWKFRQPGYSLGEELNEAEDKRIKQEDYEFDQQVGEMTERLAHAIRQDTHATNRAFIKDTDDDTR